jgi:hypothetical protein
MEAYRLEHPETQSEVAFLKDLQSSSQTVASRVPEDQRLQRVLGAWQASRPASSLLSRLRAWMVRPARIPTAVFATVALLFVAQSALLVQMMNRPAQEVAYRGEKPGCQSTGPWLRVVFAPDARHEEMVLLLRKLDMSIQQGPSETGEFWLGAPAQRSPEEALSMLRTSALVQDAMVVRGPDSLPGCAK